ncbi:hydroxyethylthiazole kinase [Limosilactobacillus sp. STM2_1]|uniref:Hydroxyethylthiazole kinase n=1 Tax=Limosilactobacillus rudii TaxID=2759755 RepID=A0A7W3UMD1_9LACO|nr:hydroxyethylthiazole kinase [Limosilactobacillus rudii]MBB1078910.1 hydroxyethylthiazole kinase [Limosilactobacillus rudii]MBB1098214.1 hydroxyethylthiazole kinase [Limosilactobacillus rudii]MCD7135671.1 hydroxyethylthiazole kinase [Limosilactobacillus rudii]
MVKHQINWSLVDQLRTKNPIILTLANLVTIDKVADAVSAIGASPIMSVEVNEAAEMVELADAIAINLGTISQQQLMQIKATLQEANHHKPLILDPVAVGAVPSRMKIAQSLLTEFHFDVIKGNASEIAALIGINGKSHGIDAGTVPNQVQIAERCARQFHTIVILTGETDLITDGQVLYQNPFTVEMLTTNVGSGDMLSSIVAAFAGITTDIWDACIVATVLISAAGVLANRYSAGLGSWQVQFFDQLSIMNTNSLLDFLEESEEDYLD